MISPEEQTLESQGRVWVLRKSEDGDDGNIGNDKEDCQTRDDGLNTIYGNFALASANNGIFNHSTSMRLDIQTQPSGVPRFNTPIRTPRAIILFTSTPYRSLQMFLPPLYKSSAPEPTLDTQLLCLAHIQLCVPRACHRRSPAWLLCIRDDVRVRQPKYIREHETHLVLCERLRRRVVHDRREGAPCRLQLCGQFWSVQLSDETKEQMNGRTREPDKEIRNVEHVRRIPCRVMVHLVNLSRLVLDHVQQHVHCRIRILRSRPVPATQGRCWCVQIDLTCRRTEPVCAEQRRPHRPHPTQPPRRHAWSAHTTAAGLSVPRAYKAATSHRTRSLSSRRNSAH